MFPDPRSPFDSAYEAEGHFFLFWVGIIFPVLWIIGALMAPTPAAAGRA